MKYFTLIALAPLAMSTACTNGTDDSDPCDSAIENCGTDSGTDDTEFYSGPIQIEHYDPQCTASEWDYYFETSGWTSGGKLEIVQDTATPWDEYHDNVPSVEYDENGYWDHLDLKLGIVTTPGEQIDNSTSLYKCNDERKSTLTWAFSIYDVDKNFVECIAWGKLPGTEFASCLDANDW